MNERYMKMTSRTIRELEVNLICLLLEMVDKNNFKQASRLYEITQYYRQEELDLSPC